jgi:IclR family KDG regulon transcriptional repressor
MRKRLLGSVLHAGNILDLFSAAQPEWGTTEIAERSGLSKSSAHALVTSLVEIGLLEKTPDRRFRLGHKLLGFSETILAGSDVFNSTRDILNDLMQKLGRSVYLAIQDGLHVVYINRLQGSSAVPASLGNAGYTLPAHASAAGKILLAHLADTKVRSILEKQGLVPLTRRTITSESALVSELRTTRKRGYAYSQGEYVPELYCIAAPVWDWDNKVVAALGIGATAIDFEMNQARMVREVTRAAGLASSELGGRRANDR